MKELYNYIEQHVDEIDTGETIRVNHSDCPAGEDTRRRLYITKKPDVALAYCHNCGRSTSKYIAHRDRYRTTKVTAPKPAIYTEPNALNFSKAADGNKVDIPAEANGWRLENKLTKQNCTTYGIQYDITNDGIILPFVGMGATNNGHQLRPLNRYGAKYINFIKDEKEELGGVIEGVDPVHDEIVIVEDYISGVHVAMAGFAAYVNYGVQVKPSKLYELIKRNASAYVVWLDNDNEVVNQRASDMRNILTMYAGHTNQIRKVADQVEPKHHDATAIVDIVLRGWEV